MSKNLLNYYRYRRKFGRKIEQVRHDLSAGDSSGVHRDFARKDRQKNPFLQVEPVSIWKRRIAFGTILVCFLSIIGLVLYHPFFFISHISINGIARIEEEEMRKAILGTIDYKKFFIIPGKSFFVVNVEEIKDVLKSRFPLTTVEVRKTFPHYISAEVHEKISTIIYDNGKQYSYLGLDGKIVEVLRTVGNDEWKHETRMVSTTIATGTIEMKEEIVSSTHIIHSERIKKELGNYPIVYDTRAIEGTVNSPMLSQETVEGIVTWFQFISSYTDIPFGYIVIDNELGEALLYTQQGWYIHLRLTNIEEQFEALKLVLGKQVERGTLDYIDLRYKGKVYWQ